MTRRSLQGEEPNPERTIQSSVKAIVTANHTSDRICFIQIWGTFQTWHRCKKFFLLFFYVTWIYTHGQQWDHHQNSLLPRRLHRRETVQTENAHPRLPPVNTGHQHLLQSNCVLCKDKNLIRNLKARMIWQMSPIIVSQVFSRYLWWEHLATNVCVSICRYNVVF